MKKTYTIIVAASIITFIVACGGSENPENKATTLTSEVDISKNPDYVKGLELVAKSDCLTCHKINEKSTGPAYSDVAAKYTPAADTTIQYLAGKIIKGGAGVWGAIPMTAHPQVTQADAEQMVKYILLLKNS
ncbi:MAG: c-type cytochrome [Deinococcales bacterium]|nr:c-type cytochrome [Chitinophagaceae bacterium]